MRAEIAEKIIEQYGNSVYRFALSLSKQKDIADDVFQEVFLRYLKKQPTFESDEHARSWFFVVTRNCVKSYFMSSWNRHKVPLSDDYPILEQKEYGVYEEVLKLPIKYRTVIHLYYYEGYSCDEIAKMLKMKSATVRTQLKRAKAQLKINVEGSELF